jgi:hypothetical protein
MQAQSPPIEAKVQVGADGKLNIALTNKTDRPIKKCCALVRQTALSNLSLRLDLGPVAPHFTGQFSGTAKDVGLDEMRPGYRANRNFTDSEETAITSLGSVTTADRVLNLPSGVGRVFRAQGLLERTESINQYLAAGAVVIVAVFDEAPLSFAVENHKGTVHHVHLARQVIPNAVPAPVVPNAVPKNKRGRP